MEGDVARFGGADRRAYWRMAFARGTGGFAARADAGAAGQHAVGVQAHAVVGVGAFDGADLEAVVEANLREAGLERDGNTHVAVGVDGFTGQTLQGGEIETSGEVGALGPVSKPFL